jgi:hypothetical protein
LKFVVALYHFGKFRNGASCADIVDFIGISIGSIIVFTNHVMVSLLALEMMVVKWPSCAKKMKLFWKLALSMDSHML